MSGRLRRLLGQSESSGTTAIVRRFQPFESTLSDDNVAPAEEGWVVEGRDGGAVRLFEIPDVEMEQCMLTYQATMRSEGLTGRAYLEMWVRIPGKGEFFSRGLAQPLKGTTAWASYQTPFRLKKGQRADLVKLNLVVEGPGTVWMKDVELLETPL
jgi:hypothetical protein